MEVEFRWDVFISYSSKDKVTVHGIADKLKHDGLDVWLDEWILRPGDSIPSKIEEGLEYSRVLLLMMSINAFSSDWTKLESQTYRFRDPLNKERRFIPVKLDDCQPRGSLGQFMYIDWTGESSVDEYRKLLTASKGVREIQSPPTPTENIHSEHVYELLGNVRGAKENVRSYGISPYGKRLLMGTMNGILMLEIGTKKLIKKFKTERDTMCVSWDASHRNAVSGDATGVVRIWDTKTGVPTTEYVGHTGPIMCVKRSVDGKYLASASWDQTIRIWLTKPARCLKVLQGHSAPVTALDWSPEGTSLLTASHDQTIRLWDIKEGRCTGLLEGHTDSVQCVSFSPLGFLAASGSNDRTVKIWNLATGKCAYTLTGHDERINDLAWSNDDKYLVTASTDKSVILWDIYDGKIVCRLFGHIDTVRSIVWNNEQTGAISGDLTGQIVYWDLTAYLDRTTIELATLSHEPDDDNKQVQYTNAKVLLVGESGAGKTGLSKRLSSDKWEPSDSTVGAWASQWRLPVTKDDTTEREIWLWDFGGQADQRLIHQLYMDETALAVLVFDGQKDDLFETLGQWDRDLVRASRRSFSRLLVAGRVDAGGLRASRSQLDAFQKERGFLGLIETSAKTGRGCNELRQAIVDGIHWDDIPWRSSPVLFKRLKDEILKLKDEGRVLMRFNELRETLQMRLHPDYARFTDDELQTVVTLLSGPGIVWKLSFGNWVLLQPEIINSYAQAVIQTIRSDPDERGSIEESKVLNGDLQFQSNFIRMPADEERFVLLAMHQTLVERALCLREMTHNGPLLIFPTYFRRERPELVGHPDVLVGFRFNGSLDEIYTTLVVRLHYMGVFSQDQLWRYAADFKTVTGRLLGIKLIRRAEGAGELELYFDPLISVEEKIIFSKYAHEHLLRYDANAERLRYYICPHCGTPVQNREVAMRRLSEGKDSIICVNCEERIPLRDQMEEILTDQNTRHQVQNLSRLSDSQLENESGERALVGEVMSTVAIAGQQARELAEGDYPCDMEILFIADDGTLSDKKVYLELVTASSYHDAINGILYEVYEVSPERANRWSRAQHPVILLLRRLDGEVRWLNVTDNIAELHKLHVAPEKNLAFKGSRFDVMAVRRWREHALNG